ncbi:MAG: DNA polymerase III subunit [Oscillospiraceae bacterium]|nr:DNA polymerase III subunit [Oscillospiraceae bacterium]
MKKIYGNHKLIKMLEDMVKNNHISHAVLFYGENGIGKKTIAEYYTYLLMCPNVKDGKPCFNCKTCHNIADNIHPDIITAEKSGKLGGYSVETVRKICSDAFIKPNNSRKKIYIFKDCSHMDERSQNTLLKIIEEPPEYVYFIFTAESKSKFLPTIISRCMSFGVSPCSEEECQTALLETENDVKSVENAVECFHGNIGMCKSFINDEKIRESVNIVKSVTDSIIRKNEYETLLAMNNLGKEREEIKKSLTMLDLIIRDAVILNYDENPVFIGCYPEGSRNLSDIISLNTGNYIHRLIEKAWHSIGTNVNITLILSALCSEIFEIL